MSKTQVVTKTCTKCPPEKNVKPITEFYICKGGRIRSSCKECDNAMSRAYKARSKKHISSYNEKYKKEHCDEISVYNHNYNKNNRKIISERQRITREKRRGVDFKFFIATSLRTKLYRFVKTKGNTCKEIESIIGCDYNALEVWFRYLFEDKMSFYNYGEYWTIDHVYPCSKYDLTKDEMIYECFNWRNLRPMIKLHNNKKVNKIETSELNNHILSIKDFWKLIPESVKENYE